MIMCELPGMETDRTKHNTVHMDSSQVTGHSLQYTEELHNLHQENNTEITLYQISQAYSMQATQNYTRQVQMAHFELERNQILHQTKGGWPDRAASSDAKTQLMP